MKSDAMMRAFISAAVDKGLRDIGRDPKRSVRQLVDLGTNFAKGRFQRYFFDIFGEMLHNENSSYYKWIHDLVVNADQKQLKTFGINLAYNSWTVGAKTVRALEQTAGYHIPWTLLFHLSPAGKCTPEMLENTVAQGQKLGIFSYMFFCEGNYALMNLAPLLKKNPDCAFVLFVENAQVDDSLIQELLHVKNTMLCLHCDDRFLETAKKLRNSDCFFSAWYMYDDAFQTEDYKEKLTAQILPVKTPFLFLAASDSCSEETRRQARVYTLRGRQAQNEPLFCIDLYSDVAFIDGVISSDNCVLAFDENGAAVSAPGFPILQSCSLQDCTLQQLLGRVLPRREAQTAVQ
ncbi:MAG: hypothetical protein LKE53_06745 [Oscillospiraceae bacterium]|nr:hypothetical protein [Oscillospiraceae bacterium]